MLKKLLIVMTMISLTACSCLDKPVGDFCDTVAYSGELGDSELGAAIVAHNRNWAVANIANKERYEKYCIE